MDYYYRSVADSEPKQRHEIIRDLIVGTVATAAITGFVLHLQNEEPASAEKPDQEWSAQLVD